MILEQRLCSREIYTSIIHSELWGAEARLFPTAPGVVHKDDIQHNQELSSKPQAGESNLSTDIANEAATNSAAHRLGDRLAIAIPVSV